MTTPPAPSSGAEGSPAVGYPRALGSRYSLERVLGAGAMGEVWVARENTTGQAVAAKLLRKEFSADPGIVGRFIQERAILIELRHPHVVQVRDLVVEGSDLAIVMDLVEGSDLRGLLQARGRLAPAEAVRITVDILDALAAAHAKGILHRDVKPDNVLLDSADPPFVRLTDFGIARLAQETTVKMTGLLGTAEYMSPEVLTAEVVSPASDVYAAGVMLYELLAGHTPFGGGGNHYAVARRHELALPPPLTGLPPALWESLAGMLAKDPARRRSAAAVAADLRGLLPGLAGLSALPPVASPTTWASLDGRVLSSEGASSVAVRGAETNPPVVDDNRTFVRGDELQRPAPEMPVAAPPAGGAEPALHPALAAPASATSLSGQTMMAPSQVREREVDTIGLAEREAARRPWWKHPAAVVGIVVVVGGVAAGAGITLSGGHSKAKAATTTTDTGPKTIPGQAQAVTYNSGLGLARSGSYDSASSVLTTTLTYTTGNTALKGDLFELVPPVTKDGGCPTVTWQQGANVVPDALLENGGAQCGFDINLGTIAAHSSQKLTYTMPFDATTAQQDGAIDTYLGNESTATDAELAKPESNPVYVVQRISSIHVDISTPTVVMNKAVQLTVDPTWVSNDTDSSSAGVLWSNSTVATSVAADLGGPVQISGGGSCAFEQSAAGPVFRDPGDDCTITATLGSLQDTTPAFTVTQVGS